MAVFTEYKRRLFQGKESSLENIHKGVAAQIALFVLSILLILIQPTRWTKPRKNEPKISVQVLVLGDIGRSPRMQYHAMSVARHGGRVDVIGYKESALHPGLVGNPLIKIVPLSPPPRILRSGKLPFILAGPLKVLWQVCSLYYTLAYTVRPAKWLMVQNPPAIPTLLIAKLASSQRRTKMLIDWHNYGWSILAGTRGEQHLFVKLSKYYEQLLGRLTPNLSFTVTSAMAKQLRAAPYNMKSPIFTLHDRPAEIFHPIASVQARRAFLEKLPETAEHAAAIVNGQVKLLISSTSWTPDEDFNLLLEALCSYASSTTPLPPILAIITGKGPQKQLYLDRIAALNKASKLRNVTISTVWLTAADYATLLSCADLGVCLHMSSSGVDLPMKVVDMFGAGLPVIGYSKYESWGELVREGINGRGFETSEDLTEGLKRMFSEADGKELSVLRDGALIEGRRRWDEEWDRVAGRVLELIKA